MCLLVPCVFPRHRHDLRVVYIVSDSICLVWRHTAPRVAKASPRVLDPSILQYSTYYNRFRFRVLAQPPRMMMKVLIYAFTRRMLPLEVEQTILALLGRLVKSHAYFRYHTWG